MSYLIGFLVLSTYGYFTWKFWSGFKRTHFSGNRIFLGLLWPVLIFNKPYRQNFARALKG